MYADLLNFISYEMRMMRYRCALLCIKIKRNMTRDDSESEFKSEFTFETEFFFTFASSSSLLLLRTFVTQRLNDMFNSFNLLQT